MLVQFALDERGEWVLTYRGEQVTVPTQMRKGDCSIGSWPSDRHRKVSCDHLGVCRGKRVNQVVDVDGGQSHKETSQLHSSLSCRSCPLYLNPFCWLCATLVLSCLV